MMYPMLPTEMGGGVENEATADGYNGDQQTVVQEIRGWVPKNVGPGGEGKNEATADGFNGAKIGVFNLILLGAALAVSLNSIVS